MFVTLGTQVEKFNTRQLFRSKRNSSVVSTLRFWCAGLSKPLDRFAAPRDKARSPIVKSKKSYALPLVDSDSFHVTPAMVLAQARDSFTARTELRPVNVIVTPQ